MNLRNYLDEHIDIFKKSVNELVKVEVIGKKMLSTLNSDGKILIAGNGGSAGDAQHFAAELVGRFEYERKGLKAISLATDTSAITAIANDFGFHDVFSRQVVALGEPGDMFIGISTSGKSASILNALSASRNIGLSTVLLTGMGNKYSEADHIVTAQAFKTAYIQEFHIFVIHCLCRILDEHLKQ